MKTLQSILNTILLLVVTTVITQTTYPQDAVKTEDENKIALRVARIAYLEGAVTVLRYTDEDWVSAEMNMPLMAGDKVFSSPGARVEIQLDDQTTVRLGSDTFVSFPYLDDAVGRVKITKGKVNVNAAKVEYVRPPFELATENMMAVILEHATVRLDVQENGNTELYVRRGNVDVQKSENEFRKIVRGEKLLAVSPKAKDYIIVQSSKEDTFDQWSDVRDAVVAAVATDNYVTPRISGYNDLNRYGDWVETADYGRVWRPHVIANDWAPYREGRWVWREPYGKIWVSSEPWGWVPYHYGRWVYVNDYNWVWVPRETVVVKTYTHYHRPVWHPALVSFTYASHGRHLSFGLSSGYYDRPVVGWFPLGVHDYYDPWYDYNRVYISHHHNHHYYPRRSFHISFGYYPRYKHHHYHHGYNYYDDHYYHHGGGLTIVNNETNIYQNQHVDGAVTVVSQDDFENGRTSRSRRVTIPRNAEPSIAVGNQAVSQVTRLSDSRAVNTRTALSSNRANGIAVDTPASRNNSSSARTEPKRAVETRNERVTEPQRTATSSALKDQQRQPETRTSSPARGTTSRTDAVAPSAQNRTSSVERPRSETRNSTSSSNRQPSSNVTRTGSENTQPRVENSRQTNTNIQRPRSSGRSSINYPYTTRSTAQPRSNVNSRTSSNSRSTSSSNGLIQRSQAERSSVSPQSTRPTSNRSYLQDRYPNRTVTRPHAPVIEPRQSRTTSTSPSRNSSVSPNSNRSSNSSNSYNFRNLKPGTVNLSPSRSSNSSNLPRVYPPQSRSNSSVNSSNSTNSRSYSSPQRSYQNSNSRSSLNGNNFRSFTPQNNSPRTSSYSPSSRSSSGSSSRSYNSSPSRSSSNSIQRNSISTPSRSSSNSRSNVTAPSRSSSSRSIQRSNVSSPSRSSGSIQRSGGSSSSRSSGSIQRSGGSSSSRSTGSTASSRSSSSGSSRSSSSNSPRR